MLTRLKWIGTAAQIAGVFMLSGRLGAPWRAFVVMLAGSLIWSLAAARTRDWAAMALNLAFTLSNLLGIYRWLA